MADRTFEDFGAKSTPDNTDIFPFKPIGSLSKKITWAQLKTALGSTFAALSHNHAGENITSGTINTDRLNASLGGDYTSDDGKIPKFSSIGGLACSLMDFVATGSPDILTVSSSGIILDSPSQFTSLSFQMGGGTRFIQFPNKSGTISIANENLADLTNPTTAKTNLALVTDKFGWKFSTLTTNSDPGSGFFRLNHATPASATSIYIDDLSQSGSDMGSILSAIGDQNYLYIEDTTDSTKFLVYTAGSATDQSGYWNITVEWVAGSSLPNSDAVCSFRVLSLNKADRLALNLTEIDAAPANAGEGVFWVKDDEPTRPQFTDDTNTEHYLAYMSDRLAGAQWVTGTDYLAGDMVVNGNAIYYVTSNHTAAAANEPGVGGDWTDFWEVNFIPFTAVLTAFAQLSYSGNGLKALRVNSSASGFEFVTRGGDYVKVSDAKAAGTTGDAIGATTWTKATINTEDSDAAGICSIASSVITLAAGTYECDISVPLYSTEQSTSRLRNTTASTTLLTGATVYAYASTFAQTTSRMTGRFTLSVSSDLEIQAYVSGSAGRIGYTSTGLSGSGVNSIYTQAVFRRIGP